VPLSREAEGKLEIEAHDDLGIDASFSLIMKSRAWRDRVVPVSYEAPFSFVVTCLA